MINVTSPENLIKVYLFDTQQVIPQYVIHVPRSQKNYYDRRTADYPAKLFGFRKIAIRSFNFLGEEINFGFSDGTLVIADL